MKISRSTRTIWLYDRKLKGYEYEIFLILTQHMGDVVSREEINRALPERKRSSGRNIDNHIKGIRQAFGEEKVIRSVRSAGSVFQKSIFSGKSLKSGKSRYIIAPNRKKILRGEVRFLTGGKVRDPRSAVDLVQFQNRQYSLDERRMLQKLLYVYESRVSF